MRTRRGGAGGSRFAAYKSRVISVSVHTPTRGPMASGGVSDTYTLSPANSTTASGEGIALTFTINTTAPNGRRVYWANVGSTRATDFVENVNNGFLDILNGSATLTLNVRNDTLTEGTETVRIALYHDQARTNVAALSGVVSVPDTSLTALIPTSLPNLSIWLDATDPSNTGITPSNNATVSSWVDKSGSSNNFRQATALTNPAYSNGALDFGNTAYFLLPTNYPISNYDFILVSTPTIRPGSFTGISTNDVIHPLVLSGSSLIAWRLSNMVDFSSQYGTTTLTNTQTMLSFRVASNGYPSISLNGQETRTGPNVSNAAVVERSTMFGGQSNYSFSWGKINEFVQYSSNLSLLDRQKVEGYLAWKWDLVASLPSNHPFKTVRPTAGVPVYTISPSSNVTSRGENTIFTFTVATDAPIGSRVYWSNVGTTNAADFTENTNSGFIDIAAQSVEFRLTLRSDNLTETGENVQIALYRDEERTQQVALSGIVSVPDVAPAFVPTMINNLSIWLDATDPSNTGTPPANNTTISSWVDRSGLNNNMTQNTVARNPTYSNNAVVFTGDQGFNYSSSISSSICDILFVSTPRTGSTATLGTLTTAVQPMAVSGTTLSSFSNGFRPFGSLSVSANTQQLILLRSASNGLLSAAINGTETLATNNIITAGNMLAFANSFGFSQAWGTINEYVYYNSNLSLSDRQKVEGYLAWKWNLVASLPSNHPFKSVRPTA